MYFDRFDILNAYNHYSQLFGWNAYTHGIQARLARLGYRPSRSEECLKGLSENAKAIFAALVRRREASHVAVGRFIKAADGRIPGLGASYREIVRAYPTAPRFYMPRADERDFDLVPITGPAWETRTRSAERLGR